MHVAILIILMITTFLALVVQGLTVLKISKALCSANWIIES